MGFFERGNYLPTYLYIGKDGLDAQIMGKRIRKKKVGRYVEVVDLVWREREISRVKIIKGRK